MREVYSNKSLPQEIRKTSNRQPNLIPKATRKKKRPENPQTQQKEKNNAEINDKAMKEIIGKINKTNSWFFEMINRIDKTLVRLNKKRAKDSSTKLEMKKERLQQTMQKYKG